MSDTIASLTGQLKVATTELQTYLWIFEWGPIFGPFRTPLKMESRLEKILKNHLTVTHFSDRKVIWGVYRQEIRA